MILRNLLFFLCAFIPNVFTQGEENQKTLTLEVKDSDRIDREMGLVYYKLTIPEGIVENSVNLAISVKENELADSGQDDFSDPDLYASKTNRFPSNPQNARWFSERYGKDLISIPKSEIKAGETIFIGVFCQKKCKYEITAKLEPELDIEPGVMYHTVLSKENSIAYRFKTRSNDYEEMEIVAFSEQMGYFRIYVGKGELPSPQKTLLAIPSWAGGYTVEVLKNTQDYCLDCYYFIVLDAPLNDVSVSIFIKYEETVTKVDSAEPIFSTLKPFKKHCYKINIDQSNKAENLIVQTELFMGSSKIKLRPWAIPDESAETTSHQIHSEKVIKITPEERKINGIETGDYYICIETNEYTSYFIRAFFESQVEEAQKFSFLYRGKEINGYLPKSKVMRYRVIEFDSESDISISLIAKKGNPKLYGYVCQNVRECYFTKATVDLYLANNKFIMPQNYTMESLVKVDNSVNTCHKQLQTEDSIKNSINNIPCGVLAIVSCEGEEECEYSIKTTREKLSLQLKPRKIHYAVLPFNETDTYNLLIQDEDVENMTIVLNSISGDADMSVYYMDEDTLKLVAISENEPYLPDVVKINKEKTGKTMKGKYEVKVVGSSFSSYSLYYYYENKNKTDITVDPSLINLELQNGHIIRDFFEDDTKYKVYAYNANSDSNLDIRITLTPERSQFGIYVFFDPKEIDYDASYFSDKIKNSKWSSLYTNELIIKKTDENYKRQATYYIVVTKMFDSADATGKKRPHKSSYWLGVTNEVYPFLLYEAVPQMSTLDAVYKNQTYWYTHPNISEPFSLSVNVFYGRVSVFADFQEIRDFTRMDLPLRKEDIDTSLFTIPVEKLQAGCKQTNNCGIYIHVQKSSQFDAQYLLVAKSHSERPEMLTSGVIRSDTVAAGEVKKYNFIVDKKQNTVLFISFLSGYGDVYLNIPKEYEVAKKATYPTREKYDYKANDFYLGKIVNLKDKEFEHCNPCQIFVSVYGKNLGYDEDQIEYTISYYDQVRKINQNQPLRAYINQGEIQYFNVYFGQKAENVYVSLTNMDGDIDLYMNYGLSLPSFSNSTWVSDTPYNEFIDFNKEHNYFTTNKLPDVSGNYTIMLYGFTNSTYTLYVTSHPKKILPVSLTSPASCRAKAGDSCYFLFDDFKNKDPQNNKDYDFIITTDYLYGSGVIYASLYSDTDYDIIEKFPCESSNHFSSVSANSRNLLKFRINNSNEFLTKNSMLLVTVECKENCFLDLNMIKMFETNIQYLDNNRENVVYIYKKEDAKKTLLVYYNWKDKDVNYKISTYSGKANFKLYTNETIYNNTTSALENKIQDIKSFSIDYNGNSTFHDKIMIKDYNVSYKTVYFGVEPLSDVAFDVKLYYDMEWTKLKVGKLNNVLLNPASGATKFYGFFDMMDDYEYAILTVSCKGPSTIAYVYMRYVYIDKKEKIQDRLNPYGYSTPDNINAEITGNTDPILSTVSIKINKPTLNNIGEKYVRMVMTIELFDLSPMKNNTNTEVDVMVSPSVNGMSKLEAEQDKLVFSQFVGVNTDVKIYDLKKRMPDDDLLVIEISNCIGDVDFKITERMNFNKNDIQSIEYKEDVSSGRRLIKVDLKKYTGDNFYLTLFPKSGGQKDCYLKEGTNIMTCSEDVLSMFTYLTTTQEKFKNSFANGRGTILINSVDSESVSLKWNKILIKDDNKKIGVSKSVYSIFISDNLFDFNHMESVCYLSQIKMNKNNTYLMTYEEASVNAVINGLDTDKRYFINVLAKNLETSEVLAYQPIEVIPKAAIISKLYSLIVIVIILVLGFLVYYFYKRYNITRKILEYEVNDVRNLSSLPRSEAELKEIAKLSSEAKYATLNSEVGSV